jgi:hypothetical protein
MSTGLVIVLIVVGVLILIALFSQGEGDRNSVSSRSS